MMLTSTTLALGILSTLVNPSQPQVADVDLTPPLTVNSIYSPEFVDSPDVTVSLLETEIDPSAPDISYIWGNENPRLKTTWGASYANSYEVAWISYHGRALAAGNVFDGLRIIQVCIWCTRNNQLQSDIVCSNATSDPGAWAPGSVVATDAWDALAWDAPKTLFNIRTARISPLII